MTNLPEQTTDDDLLNEIVRQIAKRDNPWPILCRCGTQLAGPAAARIHRCKYLPPPRHRPEYMHG